MPKAKALTPDQIVAATGTHIHAVTDTVRVGLKAARHLAAAPKTATNYKPLNLLTFCGSQKITLENLKTLPTPQPDTLTHVIVPHSEVFDMVFDEVSQMSLSVVQSVHAVSPDGSQYFAMMEVRNGTDDTDFSTILGVRNSHNKKFAASLVCGSCVLVCDNLCFSGEVKIGRRHTLNIRREFPALVSAAVEQIVGIRGVQKRRIDSYRCFEINDGEVHDLVIDAWDRGIINPAKIGAVIEEYRDPTYEEFALEVDVFRLWNSFTHVLKPRKVGNDLFRLSTRTQKLHRMLDEFVGGQK